MTGADAAGAVRVAIVVVSDRASSGVYTDRSGPAIRDALNAYLETPWTEVYRLIPDEQTAIAAALMDVCDTEQCALVLTTGGTGPAPRDVTPEATVAVCEKLLPGFGERMRGVSVATVPTAILSRQTAGVRGHSLIINLPGNPNAIRQCLDAVFAAVPDCIELIGGPSLNTRPRVIQIHRPHA